MNGSEDLTGQRINHLTVEGVSFIALGGNRYWRCQCDCGKTVVLEEHLLRVRTYCGKTCAVRRAEERAKKKTREKIRQERAPGARTDWSDTKNYRHGGARTRLYAIWRNMKCRCLHPQHPAYPRYGGRGIRICDEWLDFAEFQRWALSSGYTDKMTIDRIDGDKGYEPGNCQWLTKSEHSTKTNFEKYHRGEK